MATKSARNPITKLRDWLSLADYDAAKHQATMDTNARYARGNVAFQNGQLIDDDGLDRLSAEGDKAFERLREHASN